MAIGCAHILGYDLQCNFNLPYLAVNVAEFWRRWHISLSTWLKEYLYIPLGGNRKGKRRTYLNNFLTMLIGGLWHGASWTFVMWGGCHGIALITYKIWCDVTKRPKDYEFGLLHRFFSTIATFIFVSLCWIFFRAETFSQALKIFIGIFTLQKGITFVTVWVVLGIIVMVVSHIVAIFHSYRKAPEGFYPVSKLEKVWELTLFFVIIGVTLGLAYTGNNPFIYFQF